MGLPWSNRGMHGDFQSFFNGIRSQVGECETFTNAEAIRTTRRKANMFLSGKNTSQALKKLEAEHPASPLKEEILSFVHESERGIVKGQYNREDV